MQRLEHCPCPPKCIFRHLPWVPSWIVSKSGSHKRWCSVGVEIRTLSLDNSVGDHLNLYFPPAVIVLELFHWSRCWSNPQSHVGKKDSANSYRSALLSPLFYESGGFKDFSPLALESLSPFPSVLKRRDNVTNKRVVSMLRNDGSDNTLVDQDLPTFLNEMFGHVRLIGPCKGVVCLFGFPDNIALWNPSIRDFKKLPLSLLPRPPNAKVRGGDLGIGFDSTTHDLKETFQTTPLPSGIDVLGGQQRITRAVLPVKDSIALIVYRLQEVQKVFDIWVLNELGGNGAEGWIKATSIGPLSEVERPLGFWNNDEFILESSSRELVLYNRMNQKIKNLGVYGKRDRLEVLVHKESLFSVNAFASVNL
ncbi:UNVERIFIED_CONTAM: hypothetical protein Sangu_2792500 [Sesamum angustifolium]|uniref:F-box protein n=1 Tax=Sesamum angustifolium TaxID=2727405 RepID=A0AAW2IT08_9LAMI